jgi:hypothetical protein
MPRGMCPGGYFGAVVYELGFIDSPTLDSSLLEIAQTKRLHGEVLIDRGAITTAQRDEALVEQVHRKVHHLFTLPGATTYAFYDATAPAGEPPVAVDAVGPVWRGVRDFPPTRFVQETLRRIGDSPLRATSGGSARLPPIERALARAIAARAMTLAEMKGSTELPAARVELLVYLLVIARCVEAVSGTRTHPSTGALPVSMPSGPMHRVVPADTRPFPSTVPPHRPSGTITMPRIPVAPAGSLAALKTPAELGIDGIVARAETVDDEDYFQVLGVAEGASAEAVRAAYMRLAKTWHPDRVPADFIPIRGEVAKIFARMSTAQKALCDNDTRRSYVAARKAKTEARLRADVVREIEHALGLRDFDSVVRLCQELLVSDSDDAEALAMQAWAAIRNGEDATEDELRGALAKLERAVNVDRSNDQAVYHRGLVHKRLANLPAAFRDFARALQLNPKHLAAEREVRIFAMRARKGSGEHKLVAPLIEKIGKK